MTAHIQKTPMTPEEFVRDIVEGFNRSARLTRESVTVPWNGSFKRELEGKIIPSKQLRKKLVDGIYRAINSLTLQLLQPDVVTLQEWVEKGDKIPFPPMRLGTAP